MNKYVKDFFHRGLIFGGLGPIVLGIVLLAIDCTIGNVSLTAKDYLIATASIYLLAFVQAGATIFNQIEHWPLSKSILCHFCVLYLAYSICYIINSWIPFEPKVILIFTAIFAGGYFVTWFTVYLIVKRTSKKLNKKLN